MAKQIVSFLAHFRRPPQHRSNTVLQPTSCHHFGGAEQGAPTWPIGRSLLPSWVARLPLARRLVLLRRTVGGRGVWCLLLWLFQFGAGAYECGDSYHGAVSAGTSAM